MGIESLNTNNIDLTSSLAGKSIYRPAPQQFDYTSIFMGNTFDQSGLSFMNMDFMSIMIQQQSILSMLFNQAPNNYSLGLPDFSAFSSSPGNMSKKVGSMKLSKESCRQINDMSKRLKISPDNLKALIYSESSGNPQAVNKHTGATGLIQFMPKTAQGLGITTAQLRTMSAEQQLPYVEKYLAKAKRGAGFSSDQPLSAGQLYALVFMPAKANKEVMCSAGSKAYALNRGLDKNGDGIVTIGELGKRIS